MGEGVAADEGVAAGAVTPGAGPGAGCGTAPEGPYAAGVANGVAGLP